MRVLHEIYLIHVRIVMGLVGTQNMGFGRRYHGLFNGLNVDYFYMFNQVLICSIPLKQCK